MSSIKTLFRTTRRLAFFATFYLTFIFLLVFVFIHYQRDRGPGRFFQRIGWQAWDLVAPVTFPSPQGPLPVDPGSLPGSGSDKGVESSTVDTAPPAADVDWWELKNDTKPVDASLTFPLDKWLPYLPHEAGLTEITITRCIVPAAYTRVCDPWTTPDEDALKGPWVRVERDLDKNDGIWYLNLWYRRSRRIDIPLINDLTLLPEGVSPNMTQEETLWRKVNLSIRDGVIHSSPLYLWYQIGPPMISLTDPEVDNLITELDILFGEDRPIFGFEKLETPINPGIENKLDPVWLTVRRGVKIPPKAPPLHFNHNGTFKIMQVADLHYSVSNGECRDTDLYPCRKGDFQTQSLLSRALDAEKPDLIVFTGDQLNGQDTSWDARSVTAKFTSLIMDRKIPWAAVFGNHDDENDLDRAAQMKLLEWMPYSISQAGPKDVDGVGNYMLKVLSPDASKTHILTLYMLDSHAYTKKRIPGLFGWFQKLEYDWIKQSQIDWFLNTSASISPISRPFVPDGGKDFGSLWNRQSDVNTTAPSKPTSSSSENKFLGKPNALMFFHIPLQEAYNAPDMDEKNNRPLDVGSQFDSPGASKTNGGFFENALKVAKESEDSNSVTEVKVVGNGHCHVSDNCRSVKGIWMCFGGGGSYSGYGRVGFDRRFRVYEISDFGETIRTYKRTERDVIVDDMILAGRGSYRDN